MGLFNRQKRVIHEIHDGMWGYLVTCHGIDVDTLARDYRCVEKDGVTPGGIPATFARIFSLSAILERGVTVTGWDTFDRYPEFVIFEGYLTHRNEANFTRSDRQAPLKRES